MFRAQAGIISQYGCVAYSPGRATSLGAARGGGMCCGACKHGQQRWAASWRRRAYFEEAGSFDSGASSRGAEKQTTDTRTCNCTAKPTTASHRYASPSPTSENSLTAAPLYVFFLGPYLAALSSRLRPFCSTCPPAPASPAPFLSALVLPWRKSHPTSNTNNSIMQWREQQHNAEALVQPALVHG